MLPKIESLAYSDEMVAYAIVGQAILDEGDIGQTSISIAYHSESMAKYLWNLSNHHGLANPLHRKIRKNGAKVWWFTIRAEKRKDLYDAIGPIPDERKDRAFRHLLGSQPSGRNKYRRGEAEQLILRMLRKEGPMTRRELMYRLGTCGSSVGEHLLSLKRTGRVSVNLSVNGFGRKQTSKLWEIAEDAMLPGDF